MATSHTHNRTESSINVEYELSKFKYHITLLSSKLGELSPMEKLAIDLDFDEESFHRLYSVMSRYREHLAENDSINCSKFENDLIGALKIEQGQIFDVLEAYRKERQWPGVISAYADKQLSADHDEMRSNT